MTIVHLLALVAGFAGLTLSVVWTSLLIYQEYDHNTDHTLSLIGGKNEVIIKRFKRILVVCGGLITFGVLFGIVPYTSERLGVSVLWMLVYGCELGVAYRPLRPGTQSLSHQIFGRLMAAGFLATAVIFVRILPLQAAWAEYYLCLVMGGFAILGTAHPRRFIFYEVPFIFLSHVTIAIALLALK